MRRTIRLVKNSPVSTVTTLAAVVAALYFAQEVLIPLALSFLLTFLLAPLVTRLERRRLVGRVTAVLAVVGAAFALIFVLGWVVTRQVYSLAEGLDQYHDEIVHKAHRISGMGQGVGSNLGRLSDELAKAPNEPAGPPASQPTTTAAGTGGVAKNAAEQFSRDPIRGVAREAVGATAAPTTAPTAIGASPANPLFAVTLPAPVSPIKTLGTYLGLVLGPLGTAGLVIVFVVFMLLEREDLRDRLIRLISGGKYTITTNAIDDATTRISKYLLAQSIVNGSYGLIVAVGLFVIGLVCGRDAQGHYLGFPSFVLWGLLCALLRFVPYVGPFVAASFPVALSLAVYPGFTVFAATLGMIVLLEMVSNNVMEPWLYGTSTGMSPVALMVAAVFWTWLWGPVGLLLSTPLTVCIVVLGKHVAPLKFLDVLLGDQPALPPGVSFYQRLLAGDRVDAVKVARAVAAAKGADAVPDEVLLPALLMARRDRANDDLSAEGEASVLDATGEIGRELVESPPALTKAAVAVVTPAGAGASPASNGAPEPAQAADPTSPVDPPAALPVVLACPAHHRAEELTLQMLARVLDPAECRVEMASTRMLPSEIEARVVRDRPAVVFVAVLPPGGIVQARFLCRRLRRRFPDARIVVGFWGRVRDFDRLLVRFRSAGASYVTTSVLQSRSQIKALLAAPDSGGGVAPTATKDAAVGRAAPALALEST